MSYRSLYVGSPNEFGGRHVILFAADAERGFAASAGDTLMIELEETPAEGMRWHLAAAPAGFRLDHDCWIQDGSFTKKGPRRVKHANDPLMRRILLELRPEAEPGEVLLQYGPTAAPYDAAGLYVQLAPSEVAASWSVSLDDVHTSALAQQGLPGRGRAQPPPLPFELQAGVRTRPSSFSSAAFQRVRP